MPNKIARRSSRAHKRFIKALIVKSMMEATERRKLRIIRDSPEMEPILYGHYC